MMSRGASQSDGFITPHRLICGGTTGTTGKNYNHCCTNFVVGFPSHFNLHKNIVVNIGESKKLSFVKINFDIFLFGNII